MSPKCRRNVLVTGASRGIGRAVAQAFAFNGDKVAVHYSSNSEGAQHTLESLEGVGHVTVRADLQDPDDCQELVARVVAELGPLDVLVNNAGVAPSDDNSHPIMGTCFANWREVWKQMLDVNLLGSVNLTWAFAQQVDNNGRVGAVVNIGSRGAFRGEPEHPAYATSKAGLHAFAQSIAPILAPHDISVTSVAPGVVATERQEAKLGSPQGDVLRAQSPFGRVATPEEVADAVLYLAAPEAIWASGTVLDLNGASYLRP